MGVRRKLTDRKFGEDDWNKARGGGGNSWNASGVMVLAVVNGGSSKEDGGDGRDGEKGKGGDGDRGGEGEKIRRDRGAR